MTLAEHLVGPLTFDVTPNGTLYIGQDFAGLLTKVSGGASEVLASGPGIAAVSILGDVVTWGEREGTWSRCSPPGSCSAPQTER